MRDDISEQDFDDCTAWCELACWDGLDLQGFCVYSLN